MRILDLSTDFAGRYAARLLADCGHDVTAVEIRRDGTPLSPTTPTADLQALDLHLSRNKTRAFVEANSDLARQLAPHLAGADAVIHTFAPGMAESLGLSLDSLRSAMPGGRLMTVTPYGYAAPFAERGATEKTLQADGGLMLISGGAETLEAGIQPLDLNMPLVATVTGAMAAMSLAAAQVAVGRRNAGFAHIDVAARDLIPASLEKLMASFTYLESVNFRGTRGGRLNATAGLGDQKAKDGYFHVFTLRDAFKLLAQLIGRDDLAEDPEWSDPKRRTYTFEETKRISEEGVATLTVAELSRRAAELRMPSGPIVEVEGLGARAQLQHRNALNETSAGIEVNEPYRFANIAQRHDGIMPALPIAELPVPPARPAGAAAGTTLRAPLKGVRVLDLTQAYAGPASTRLLAELGAEVLKVESIKRLDLYPRTMVPFDNATDGDFWERSAYFADRNLNKKGITLDLSTPAGRDAFARLAAQADVVATNYTPRVMPAWGFGPDQLLALNPRLVVLAMSGFGATGPDRDMPALAGLIEAASGFTSRVRYSDDARPVDAGFSFGDMVSGMYAALAAVIALERREETGRGDAIDLSCAEAPLPFLVAQITALHVTGHASSVAEEIVPGGRHIFIRCAGAERWAIAFERGDQAGVVARLLQAPEQDATGGRRLMVATLDGAACIDTLRAGGIVAAELKDAEQIHFDPELQARQMFDIVTRPGIGPLPHAKAITPLVDGEPLGAPLSAPPRLGADTRAVLSEIAGMSAAEIDALFADEVAGKTPLGPIPSILRVPLPLDELEALGRIRRARGARARLAEAFGYAEVAVQNSVAA